MTIISTLYFGGWRGSQMRQNKKKIEKYLDANIFICILVLRYCLKRAGNGSLT